MIISEYIDISGALTFVGSICFSKHLLKYSKENLNSTFCFVYQEYVDVKNGETPLNVHSWICALNRADKTLHA